MKLARRVGIAQVLLFVLLATTLHAQKGVVVSETVHGKSLEGNLLGDSPDRSVLVYLPPSYETSKTRFPVVYLLHGFTATNKGDWNSRQLDVVPIFDRLIAAKTIREFIVVMPDAHNRLFGSFYTNSISTGDWEDFITQDLVAFIDGKYRTLAAAGSRGIAGGSMGGYGALKLAMKHPDVFGAVYALSACCLLPQDALGSAEIWQQIGAARTNDDVARLSFFAKANLALAAAWSPDPKAPPFFADFPARLTDGKVTLDPAVIARWTANNVVPMTDQYVSNWHRLRGIAFDCGTQDGLITGVRQLSAALTRNGIHHTYEEYDGDHYHKWGERIEMRMAPFFSRTLEFQGKP
jgi:enterochelin esterase-like enzyme